MSIQALLGKKIGTTQVFKEDTGEAVCVTAIETGPCTVTQIKSSDTDGYEAVQIGFEEVKRGNKPAMGHLDKSGGKLFRHLREVGDLRPCLRGGRSAVRRRAVRGGRVDKRHRRHEGPGIRGRGQSGTASRAARRHTVSPTGIARPDL